MESGVNIDSYNIPYGTHPTVSSIDIFKNKINHQSYKVKM